MKRLALCRKQLLPHVRSQPGMDRLFEPQLLPVAGQGEGLWQCLRVRVEPALYGTMRHVQDLGEVFKRQGFYRCHVAVL